MTSSDQDEYDKPKIRQIPGVTQNALSSFFQQPSENTAAGAPTADQTRSSSIPSAEPTPHGISVDADLNTVRINLREASIEAAAKLILGDILNINYTIDPAVKASITIQTAKPIRKSDLLSTFEYMLALNNVSIRQIKNIVYIGNSKDAADLPPPLVKSGKSTTNTIGKAINVFPLTYISAKEAAKLLDALVGEGKVLYADEKSNIIYFSGNSLELSAAQDAISVFDDNFLKGMNFLLVPVKNAKAETIVEELDKIFSTEEGGKLNGLVRFLPNDRLASVLVVSVKGAYLEEARHWIERLDRAAAGTKQKLFVYTVQNREAEELAEILGKIISSGNNQSQSAPSNSGSQSSQQTDSDRFASTFDIASNRGVTTNGTQQSGNNGQTRGIVSIENEAMRVVADTSKNALLIYSNLNEYETILPMIKSLDSLPSQVLLEATIAEVALTDELQFGLRWYFENGNFAVTLSDAASGAVGSTMPGFSMLFSAGKSKIALNALSSVTDVNIISSPNLMVLDNKKAVLQIGDQVPIATQSSVRTDEAAIVNSIQLKDTGIILGVTPRINESGRVILDIEQEVSDVVKTTTSGIDSPTIRQRRVKTTVVVNDNESLALGGLIQGRNEQIDSKVPVLGEAPIIGNLFKHKQDIEKRTELLILITPRVVRDFGEASRITDEFRRQLGGLKALSGTREKTIGEQIQRIID
ncbi:type II secretion system secretin GspD [Pannonibacter tanglangensis]|uniref:Type II secretion system secretin GspD n=1 Tax=Pannonibacter tanglangensis TaxID=2750084 RepID=A0ABW9ZMX9_9HYPH|nr:type II secretion system secretin GspD [Pannonibacter sp. XCT-34]NBN66078.1 type II secretion system secretin GspD [Pannonibacter sp. XCT-34]